MAAEAVKVIVRCRPLNQREKGLNCKTVVQMDSSIGQVNLIKVDAPDQPPKTFTFDGVYHVDSITENIYADIAYPLVEGVIEGYNGTIFAYGQTGCGKSFTMQGIPDPPTQRGIIPRAFEHIFESMQTADSSKYLVHASYLEIYNEEIRDLMGKDHKQRLEIKEHPDKGVYVKDLSMVPCHNVRDMDKVMDTGGKNRSVGATLMNADSSRSHSIFTIFVETVETSSDGTEHIRAGKLNLVDLAGSERQAKTGATGDRLKEATKINLSLSALGNVISALVDGKSKHIPYRDSKLTRLLQDSLGGNTKTLMVSCVSPADNNYDETLSTLRYANRAKNIKNKPKINEDPKDALLREYQDEIQMLKKLLMGQLEANPDVLAKLGLPGASIPGKSPIPSQPVSHVPSQEMLLIQAQRSKEQQASDTSNQEEIEKIKKEYEAKISDLEQMFKNEQTSKQKLSEDLEKLTREYNEKLMHIGADAASTSDKEIVPSVTETPPINEASDTSSETVQRDESMKLFKEKQRQSPSLIKQLQNEAQKMQVEAVKGIGLLKTKLLSGSQQELAVSVSKKDGELSAPTFSVPDALLGEIQGKGSFGAIAQHLQDEALKRLQSLQEQLVGGEKKNDQSLREKRKARQQHAMSKRQKMIKAVQSMEDDGIIVKVYDTLHEEIRAKGKHIERLEKQVQVADQEINDLQTEFERDREDYLDTIRKLEQQVKLQQQMLDKVQPCIRRDCNYYNLDRIKHQSIWDDEIQKWILPELVVEKTVLPTGLSGGPRSTILSSRQPQHSQQANGKIPNGDFPPEYFESPREDKLLRHLNDRTREDAAASYFKPKRAEKLLSGSPSGPQDNKIGRDGRPHKLLSTMDYPRDLNTSSENIPPLSPSGSERQSRPVRLESLPQSAFEKKKKKSKNRGMDI